MASITFKAKVRDALCPTTDTTLWRYIEVPVFGRHHCDMIEFRRHSKFSSYANSDLFLGMLARLRRDIVGEHSNLLRLDRIPPHVKIDTTGFLATITIEV